MIKKYTKIISKVIIPGDKTRLLPSGANVHFYEFLVKHSYIDLIEAYIKKIEDNHMKEFNFPLKNNSDDYISAYIINTKNKNLRNLNQIAVLLCECYYTDEIVLSKLGLPVEAPFPKGNILNEIDLTILGDVYNRGKIYK